MQKVLNFLKKISENNNREWFEANKNEYLEARDIFNSFVEKLIAGIGTFDPSIKGLTIKDCTYRFYRDIRFSTNKMPFKTHFGAYICPHGKKSGYSGYYFHIEPKGEGFLGGSQLDTGLYRPEQKILNSIREEISLNGDQFEETIIAAKGFRLDDDQPLKRVPRGYPADSPYAEYLKLKNPILCKQVDEEFILDKNLLENTIKAFNKTVAFNTWLNKAVKYAFEEK
ncbi:DUF2461 domain-containing protein [Alkalitalea saponilacus]|uniref:TIGR02453 family protein n=1 Tax=Alkalitalea saponilacus TaxID=889453 RepID=A0A1T5HSE3_9BACT|nr:DUF2461 domain-containing protein [Alkalitalea saponilacus]ASB47689.1 TIGR02453 family protein [Alkalitalea saponilacus]SKC23614.1 TIGR02453 family protein [Alkalitalea saponilacus]